MKREKWVYGLLFGILLLCGGATKAWAQTNEDLRLGYTPLVCVSDTAAALRAVTVQNFCLGDTKFEGGVFKVSWGDGNNEMAWPAGGAEWTHRYQSYGSYTMTFYWDSNDGTIHLKKDFPVTIKRGPVAGFTIPSSGSCVNATTSLQITGYERESSETKYIFQYGGVVFKELTQAEVMAAEGAVLHVFTKKICDGLIQLTLRNECVEQDFITEESTATLKPITVMAPVVVDFAISPDPACTENPFQFEIDKSQIGVCNARMDYTWTLQDKGSYSGENPSIPSYDTPGDYDVTLLAKVGGYACANATVTKKIKVIKHVTADFSFLTDTLCMTGVPLDFENHSTGDRIDNCVWRVDNDMKTNASVLQNFSYPFTGPGSYNVELLVKNSCSSSTKDTTIVVKQSPEILSFKDLQDYDSLCPQSASARTMDMNDYLVYDWHGNTPKAHWTIVPADGVVYEPDFGPETVYPRFTLKPGKTYDITVQLDGQKVGGAECGDPAKRVMHKKLKINDPVIHTEIIPAPGVVDGKISICYNDEITFTNTSTGENLKHVWTVAPATGVEFIGSSATSASPVIKFKQYGDYVVTNHMTVQCNGSPLSFNVHVAKDPTIFMANLLDTVCPGDLVNMQGRIVYRWNGNLPDVHWSITPETIETAEGTTLDSPYPKVRFKKSGIYNISVNIPVGSCPESDTKTEASGEIKIWKSALTSEIVAEDGLEACENGILTFTNTAEVEEGDLKYNWSVSPAENCEFISGNTSLLAGVLLKAWGTYQVTGKVSGYCGTLDSTMTVIIHKDPEVTLEDTAICPGILDLSGALVQYNWWNNTPAVTWEILRTDGAAAQYTFSEGNLNSLYPKINFPQPGKYQITATLTGVPCEGTKLVDTKIYTIYDPAVTGEITMIPAVAGHPDVADICENDIVAFTNTEDEEAGGVSWAWSVSGGQTDGYAFQDGGTTSVAKNPDITFTKYGDYVVKVITSSTCNAPREKTFHVTVRGIPEFTLEPLMEKICAGTELDMGTAPGNGSNYLNYVDKKNNILTYAWTVTPDRSLTTVPVWDATAEYPKIQLHENAHYTIGLTVTSKCTAPQSESAEIDVIRNNLSVAFSVGKDSVGCTDDQYEITLENRSEGDSLEYTWSVNPDLAPEKWEYREGNAASRSPKIKINQQGFYDVSLAVKNICANGVANFRLKAFSVPTVTSGNIAGVCDLPYLFRAGDTVRVVHANNDPVKTVLWTITPGSGAKGYEYVTGGTHTFSPEITFKAGDYQVRAEYWNRCTQPGTADFNIKVDEFIPIEPALSDQSKCVLTEPFLLEALPAGGNWTLKTPADVPGAGDVLYQDASGNYYFNPKFDPYVERDVEVVYRKDNHSCIALDTLNIHIWPLPHVNAGDDPEMCIEKKQQELTEATPAGGDWKQGQNTLPDNLFTATIAGVYDLKYFYTDVNTCTNVDSVKMTVHPQPDPEFDVAPLNCIYTDVAVVPQQKNGNTFEWNFGDGSLPETSTGDTVHKYNDFGDRNIVCVVTSGFGCKDTSAVMPTEIVNLPPAPFFDMDSLNGCDPVDIQITINPATYADNHNYLSFRWDYGEGAVSDDLMPVSPKHYAPGAWDTTYVTRFTVSNRCDTLSFDREVTVFSSPEISFVLRRDWECAPVVLELQNTTTGNSCEFDWTFINSRTNSVVGKSNVRNPIHEFTTDELTTPYYIKLKAKNKCAEKEYTDTLVVKPRTISPHFSPLPNPYACVNQKIRFRNNSTDTLASILNTYWDFGDGKRDTVWSPAHSYDDAGTYNVLLKIDNGCGWDTVSNPVKIYSLPKLKIESQDFLCEADTFTFVLKPDRDVFTTWKFGDGHTGNNDSLRYTYNGYGAFKVTAIGRSADINHCTDSVSKDVMVHNKPIVTILPLDTVLCSPLLYQPVVTKMNGDLFMWDWGDGSALDSAPGHLYENPTDSVQKWRVKAYVETDKGCKSDYERTVKVFNLPKAALGKTVEKGKPQRVTFLNQSVKATDCIWYLPFGEELHSTADQVVMFDKTGLYSVGLLAFSYEGCRDSVGMEHEVIMKGLYFPNTFIPHSTNDKISRFNGIAIGLKEYHLEIYDQYNNKLWETRALENGIPSEGWDGRNMKGQPMIQGMYIWRAKAIFMDDEVWTGNNNESGVGQTVQGSVLLLRK